MPLVAPTKIQTPWASGAAPPYVAPVPVPSQIAVPGQAGRASWTDGFPPLNFVQRAVGGVPPFGEDMNGALQQVSAGLQWQQAGGPLPYDAAFVTSTGGYPLGAVIASASFPGMAWASTTANNTTNPDTGGAGWAPCVLVSSSVRANAGTSATYTYAGNPNGHLAGTAATATSPPDTCWDYNNDVLYTCTTSGNAAAAVWTALVFSSAVLDVISYAILNTPGGRILWEWGGVSGLGNGASVFVTFPKNFSTTAYITTTSVVDPAGPGPAVATVLSKAVNGFSIANDSGVGNTINVNWMAIGGAAP